MNVIILLLTAKPYWSQIVFMASLGLSMFIIRGRNSVATPPGEIAYGNRCITLSNWLCLTVILMLDFMSRNSFLSPSVSAVTANFVDEQNAEPIMAITLCPSVLKILFIIHQNNNNATVQHKPVDVNNMSIIHIPLPQLFDKLSSQNTQTKNIHL